MHARETWTPYLTGATPGLSTDTAPTGGPIPRLGELGKTYMDPYGIRWQRVKAAGTLTQAAVASNVFYWAAAHGFVVDTDLTDSENGRNSVAGVFGVATAGDIRQQTLPTANQLFWALQEGPAVTFNGTTVNFTAGSKVSALNTVGLVTTTAEGTAAIDTVIATVHTAVDRSGGAGTVVCDACIVPRPF